MNEREIRKLGFIREIIGCFISPRSSLQSILQKPSLMKAIALILVIAIIAAAASFNYAGKLPLTTLLPMPGAPINSERLRPMLIIMSAMTALIGVFGTWFISSALIHGFSRALRGEGSFRSMLTLAGYASAPLLIQQLLRLADSFMVSQEALQLITNLQISAHPLLNMIANAAVDTFTIFRIWSIALLIVATRENYRMSTIRSTVAMLLSVIIIVFMSAFLPLM